MLGAGARWAAGPEPGELLGAAAVLGDWTAKMVAGWWQNPGL